MEGPENGNDLPKEFHEKLERRNLMIPQLVSNSFNNSNESPFSMFVNSKSSSSPYHKILVVKCNVCFQEQIKRKSRMFKKNKEKIIKPSDIHLGSEQKAREFIQREEDLRLEQMIRDNKNNAMEYCSKMTKGKKLPQNGCYCLYRLQSHSDVNNTASVIRAMFGYGFCNGYRRFTISFIPKDDGGFSGYTNWGKMYQYLNTKDYKWTDNRPKKFMSLLEKFYKSQPDIRGMKQYTHIEIFVGMVGISIFRKYITSVNSSLTKCGNVFVIENNEQWELQTDIPKIIRDFIFFKIIQYRNFEKCRWVWNNSGEITDEMVDRGLRIAATPNFGIFKKIERLFQRTLYQSRRKLMKVGVEIKFY